MWLLLFYILTLSPAKGGGHEVVVCPPNNQLFISGNRSLLPLENIQASSESPSFPTTNILNANSGWCTNENAPSFIGEYVNFTFTQPVVLTMILSSSFFTNQYVNNFSIAYSPSEDGNGSFFDIYGVTSTPQDFFVPSNIGPFRLFTLEQPIVATKLQLVINDGVSVTGSDTCWVVGMLGCTLSEAETIGPPESDRSTTPPSVTRQSREGATREEVLAIALPIALGTIVVVIIIMAAGVVISVKCKRKEKQSLSMKCSAQTSQLVRGDSDPDSPQEATLREVHNVLYEDDTGRLRSETVREVQNILYEDNTRQEDRTYEPVAVSVDSSVRYSGLVQDQQPNDRIQVAKNESYGATHGYGELPREQ